MATKPRNFNLDSFYHVYNCGTDKRVLFLSKQNYLRFLDTAAYYLHYRPISYSQYKGLTESAKIEHMRLNPIKEEHLRIRIIAYCIMPNHFHFMLKQAQDSGITNYIADLLNSYTKYFNIKNERFGRLFQGTFKAKDVSQINSLFQVSRYIHLNPMDIKGINDPSKYLFSSYNSWIPPTYTSTTTDPILDTKEIESWLKEFGGKHNYKDFVDAKIGTNPAAGIESLVFDAISQSQTNP